MKYYENAYEILKNSYDKFFNQSNNENSFEFLEGSKDGIIFSCPHAVSQMREGKEKLADINTGPLGVALNSLGYNVLIKTKNCNDDANYDKKSEYKNFLSKLIKEKGFLYLIDLHGMSKKRNVIISLGTLFGTNSDENLELTKYFIKIASSNKLSAENIRIDFPFHASKRTVSSSINRKNKIETLQIEINSKCFETQEDTIKLIKTLDDYANLTIKAKTFNSKNVNLKEIHELNINFTNENFNEKPFYFNNKQNNSILLTSPHSQSMFKENKECYKETYSGALALTLSESLNLSSLVKTSSTNYDSSEEYISNVVDFVNKNKTKLVIEFHVMNPLRNEDIVILTNNGNSIEKNFDLMSIIIKTLSLNGLTNFSLDYPFNAENLNSSVNLIHTKSSAMALQIIINQKVFNNKKLKRLVKCLQQIINKAMLIL